MKNYHRRDMMKSKRAGRFEETGVYLKKSRSIDRTLLELGERPTGLN